MAPDPTRKQAVARVDQDLPPDMAKFYAHFVCVQAVSCNMEWRPRVEKQYNPDLHRA